MEDFKVGDLVYKGSGKTKWKILKISEVSGGGHLAAWLENPLTGRKTAAYLTDISHNKQPYKWRNYAR